MEAEVGDVWAKVVDAKGGWDAWAEEDVVEAKAAGTWWRWIW